CTCVDATLSPFAVAVHRRPPPSPLFPYTTLFRSLEHWKTEGHGPDARCPDLDRFRAVADEHRDAGAWRLTLCGMTRADVMGLRWSDIDLDAGTVTVRQGRVILDGKLDHAGETKTPQRRRTVPVEIIEPGTIELLRAMQARQAEDKLAAGTAY